MLPSSRSRPPGSARAVHCLLVVATVMSAIAGGGVRVATAQVESAGPEAEIDLTPRGFAPERDVTSDPLSAPDGDTPAFNAGDPATVPWTEATTAPDAATMQAAIDQAVAARLARHPPFYVPATDFAPPKGLVLHATTHRDSAFPFALALNGYLQARWLNLARGVTQWTNALGDTEPVLNENSFNLNRIYLQASGYVGSERVIYNLAAFGTTNAGLLVTLVPVGFVGYAVTEDLKIGAGVTQVPGSREWLISSQWPIGVDRSMVNTFIRPSYSPGVFALGSLLDKTLSYQAGVWNGIDGGAAGYLKGGTAMAWAGNMWWDPLGPFGLGYSDMEHHDAPAVRLGTSGVTARSPATIIAANQGFPNPENTVVRLSDGTPLALSGALGPGSQVEAFNYNLATVDVGWKWRGFSAFGEYSWRLLDGFTGTGSFDRSSLFDQGGSAFVGWCFLPRTHEIYGRSSALTGPFGSAQEFGGGFNWYLHGTRQNRLTFEALWIESSPAQNPLYPYRAGFTGTAIQTQYLVLF